MNREQARNHLAEWLDEKMWRCFGTIDREAISIAVEALSPRRREDATEEDYAYCDDCEAVEMCMWYPYDGCIFKIQSRPQGEWIPCSERLPSKDGFYIATCDGEICGEEQPFTGFAEFENRKWVDDEDDYQCVLAWMPLPEPYKGGDTE